MFLRYSVGVPHTVHRNSDYAGSAGACDGSVSDGSVSDGGVSDGGVSDGGPEDGSGSEDGSWGEGSWGDFSVDGDERVSSASVAASAYAIACGLGTLVHLTSLNLMNTNLQSGDLQYFADAFGTHMPLARLLLSGNRMCAHSALDAAQLARLLTPLTTLTLLGISDVGIEEGTFAPVAEALSSLTSLAHLKVCSNDLGPHGTALLGATLRRLKRLSILNVSAIFGGKKRAREVDYGTPAVRDRNAEMMALALSRVDRLTAVDVSENGFTTDGVNAILTALEGSAMVEQVVACKKQLSVSDSLRIESRLKWALCAGWEFPV